MVWCGVVELRKSLILSYLTRTYIQYIGTSPIRVANMRVWCFNDKNKETRRLKQVYIELCVGGAWRAVPVYE